MFRRSSSSDDGGVAPSGPIFLQITIINFEQNVSKRTIWKHCRASRNRQKLEGFNLWKQEPQKVKSTFRQTVFCWGLYLVCQAESLGCRVSEGRVQDRQGGWELRAKSLKSWAKISTTAHLRRDRVWSLIPAHFPKRDFTSTLGIPLKSRWRNHAYEQRLCSRIKDFPSDEGKIKTDPP